jgi:hypothetical protein
MDVFTAIMHQKHNLILCLLFIVSIAYYHSWERENSPQQTFYSHWPFEPEFLYLSLSSITHP